MNKVEMFNTEVLGDISMSVPKKELLERVQEKGIKCKETPRTVMLENEDGSNMMYFIFSDALDRVVSVDLGGTELVSVVIDGERYTPEEIRENLKWKHTMYCSHRGEQVRLNDDMNASCSTGLKCRMCLSAEQVTHEAFLTESVITYVDFGEVTDNEMFCFENNHGKPVDFKKIQSEDADAMKHMK